MRKFIALIISLTLAMFVLDAQTLIGEWQTHYSYERMQQVVNAKGVAFVVADGHLFSYNPEDEHVKTYTKINGLNDSNISKIGYNKSEECLVIIYENTNIDLYYNDDEIINIPNLNLSYSNLDKTVNDINMHENLAYVSTGFGFFTINVSKAEIKETAVFNMPIKSLCVFNNDIYMASQGGVLKCSLNNNIQDLSEWVQFPVSQYYNYSDYSFSDRAINQIFVYKDKLHFLVPMSAVYYMESDGKVHRNMQGNAITNVTSANNDMYIAYNSSQICLPTSLSSNKIFYAPDIFHVDYAGNNRYWITSIDKYLSLAQINENDYEISYLNSQIKPNGPLNNYCFYLTYENNKLMTTGGGYYADRYNTPAQLSEYRPDTGWTTFSKAQIDEVSGENARDFATVISHPEDENHLFVTSWGEGIYEFKDHKCIKLHNDDNSTLQDIFNGDHYIRVDGLAYDHNGNLWTTNSFVSHAIKVLKKDGTWTQLYSPDLANIENLKSVMVDRNNVKWITTGNLKSGFLLIDENNTFENTADDQYKYVGNNKVNQQGTNISFRFLHSLVEDKNGNVWLATDTGPYVIHNSKDIFSKNIVFNQIAIPRNDGTNYIDYLLNQVDITCIAIDGANRKWMSTSTSGLYLISADGMETIHHFTTDNSPLPSNNVRYLAMDEENGIIYIGTTHGILSYKSDSEAGSPDYKNVSVYPNPVREDYEGDIIITGLMENSTVKITDLNGNIIKQGISLGGQFIWDGRNQRGLSVKTGVYLIFGSTEDASQGVVSKVMIVK